MGNFRKIITPLHLSTKRNYLYRMNNNKVKCMNIAQKYSKDYWDGNRKYGYGGYKYIPGRWSSVAKKLISIYRLNSESKILDVGCGKGYLLYEIKKIIPGAKIVGIDISKYALKNSKKEIKNYLFKSKAQEKYKYKSKYFDLVISMGTLHNLGISDLKKSVSEIERVGKKKYIMVESFRNDQELFNLQCWALTCETFLKPSEWIWLLKNFGYSGDYEFIYFK